MPGCRGRRRLSAADAEPSRRATAEVRLTGPLHARAAARVVELARTVGARITVSRASEVPAPADATSMLALLALRLGEGEVVRLEGDGAGAERAVASLADLLAHDPVEGTPPR